MRDYVTCVESCVFDYKINFRYNLRCSNTLRETSQEIYFIDWSNPNMRANNNNNNYEIFFVDQAGIPLGTLLWAFDLSRLEHYLW
jgi:hypothetical protein